ncbi:MAG: sodium:calcium antiporter [Candidatus Chisholmbacteria bacterium]|nr:sodium:calcium antiporter [Candidatus Chisholmbacteria bacterium]
MMFFIDLGLIIFFSLLLAKGTQVIVRSLHRLAERTRLGTFGLAAFLVALATGLPEIFVAVTSALEGVPELSLGNVMGANIANLSLVIGLAALVGGSVGVVGEFLRQDFFTAFLAASLPMLLLLDGTLGRIDAVVLLTIYVIFNVATLWKEPAYRQRRRIIPSYRFFSKLANWDTDKEVVWIIVGSGVVLFAAQMLVSTAIKLAAVIHVPEFLVGLFFVSVGTTLPELSFGIAAIRRKEVGMVYGNVLGSVVANATLVIGLAALISPIKLQKGFSEYLLATMAFVVVFSLFWVLAYSKKKLTRGEGLVLLLVYLGFILLEFWRASGGGV